MVNILGFVDHMVHVATARLCHVRSNSGQYIRQWMWLFPNKTLCKKVGGRWLACGHSFASPCFREEISNNFNYDTYFFFISVKEVKK